jgi:hypothetical protein
VCADAKSQGLGIVAFFHVPPLMSIGDSVGYQGWHPQYSTQFAELYEKYRFAMVTAHIHIDAFLPFAGGVILSAPGVSPRHDNNPTFRVFRMKNGQLLDYDQYFADLLAQPTSEPKWKLEYSFRTAYGTADLSQKELRKVTRKIEIDDELLWKYRSFMFAGHYPLKDFHRCMLKAATQLELDRCALMKKEVPAPG